MKNNKAVHKVMNKVFLNGVVFVLYMVMAWLGLKLAIPGTVASIVWLPAGIAVGSALIFGYVTLPAVFMGAMLINFITFDYHLEFHFSLAIASFIAFGNTMEAFMGAYLIRNYGDYYRFDRPIKSEIILFLSILVAAMFSAFIGSYINYMLDTNADGLGRIFLTWYLGDVSGITAVIVTLLMISDETASGLKYKRPIAEQIIYFSLYTFFIAVNFIGINDHAIVKDINLFFYLIMLFVLWAIFRFPIINSVISLIMFLVVSIFITVKGQGPFYGENLDLSLFAIEGLIINLMMFAYLIRKMIIKQHNQQLIIEQNYIEIKKNSERANSTQKAVIRTMVRILEVHDEYTKGHSENVAELSSRFARYLGLSEEEIETTYMTGLIHDIGKLIIPKRILNKSEPLTEAELVQIHMHPEYSDRFLKENELLKDISLYVYHHHEKWDGSGYPSHLSGDQIPFISQIISIADAYDAMTSERPYRKALSDQEAVLELISESNYQFDDKLVTKFINMMIDL